MVPATVVQGKRERVAGHGVEPGAAATAGNDRSFAI
jgi:hypothetical protein